jgi:DNA helicase-2/ATP-dependent DNA helicase PcrA
MIYQPNPVQQQVIDATDPVLLVLGGAGTGKTTTAAAATRIELARRNGAQAALPRHQRRPGRALFLSFSRAAVTQVLDRSADILGPYRDQVQVTTYHAFAWRLLQQYGTAIGQDDPHLTSSAEAKLLPDDGNLGYDHLLPYAVDISAIPAVAAHLRARWSLIVCDEFQDTDPTQFELLTAIRGHARLLLLGDPNQCIYTFQPGVAPERVEDALALPGARKIVLPEASHRDPSGVLPAAASAIRRREFTHPAVTTAIGARRLRIDTSYGIGEEADAVAAAIDELLAEGHNTIGVFSHHNDATSRLSDQLAAQGVDHEIVGLPDCLTAALQAQYAMLAYSAGTGTWPEVRRELAVFITSAARGQVPDLAKRVLGSRVQPGDAGIGRLNALREDLAPDDGPVDLSAAASQAAAALPRLKLPAGQRHWDRAAHLLRTLTIQSRRQVRDRSDTSAVLDRLRQAIAGRRVALLTDDMGGTSARIQLMGLYQTKGREARHHRRPARGRLLRQGEAALRGRVSAAVCRPHPRPPRHHHPHTRPAPTAGRATGQPRRDHSLIETRFGF